MLYSLLLCVASGAAAATQEAQASSPHIVQPALMPTRCLQTWWNALDAFKNKDFNAAIPCLLAHVQSPPYAPPVVALINYLFEKSHLRADQLPEDIEMLVRYSLITEHAHDLVKSFKYFWEYQQAKPK